MLTFVLPEADERTVLKIDTEGNKPVALEDERVKPKSETSLEVVAPACWQSRHR